MALEPDDRALEPEGRSRQLDPTGSEVAASHNFGRRQVRIGMQVVGTDAVAVGRVKEVRDSDFLVDRPLKSDVSLPFEAIVGVMDEEIVVNVAADEVDQADSQGWPR